MAQRASVHKFRPRIFRQYTIINSLVHIQSILWHRNLTRYHMLPTDTLPDTTASTWPKLKLKHGTLETHRAYPHAFIRSALFSSRKFSGGAIRTVATEEAPIEIASLSNYKLVQVAGERLDQGDCDVYAWLLTRAYQRGLAGNSVARIFFTQEEAMSERGRKRGTKNFMLFRESLQRLYKADLVYETPYATGRTRLIFSIHNPKPEYKKKYDYEVVIFPEVGDFFREGDFRILMNEEREKLDDYLSKWLHAFYSSHAHPLELTCDLIKTYADRADTPDAIWRKKLDTALLKVKEVTGWLECEARQENGARPKIVVRKGKRQFQRRESASDNPDDE
jgi:hypothetical protein